MESVDIFIFHFLIYTIFSKKKKTGNIHSFVKEKNV